MGVDWEELYRSTYRELVRFLHRRVWDGERAQELAQEVFVRALEQEGSAPANPRAWLFTVARNLARDEARTVVRRKKHLELLQGGEGDAPVEPEAVACVERGEETARVRRALDALSERDREVLLLWDAGLDYGEIAGQTGLAVGAIGTTLARARRRLVDAYERLEKLDVARG